MLYTTYSHYTVLDKLPDDMRKILIMRWEPRFLDRSKYNLEHMPNLAPSDLLLARYKDKSISFNEFTSMFKQEMLTASFQSALDDIRTDLDEGKDVAIICCEKDPLVCHRNIIANVLSEEGYECKEWGK